MLIATPLFCVHDTGFIFSSLFGAAYLANSHERKDWLNKNKSKDNKIIYSETRK